MGPVGAGSRHCRRRGLFWVRQTLVGIEPTRLTAFFCRNVTDRTAETWSDQLEPFVALEIVVSDAARGITAAVGQLAEARRRDPAAPGLEHGLDIFHTAMEAHRVLARHWRRTESTWEQAADADVQVSAKKRQGVDAEHGPRRLTQGPDPLPAGRAVGSGLGPDRRRVGVVPCRGPAQRPGARPSRDRRGAGGSARCGLVEGPRLPLRPAEPGLPGPDAPPTAIRPTRMHSWTPMGRRSRRRGPESEGVPGPRTRSPPRD